MIGRWVWTGEGTGKPLLEGKVKMRADPEHARMRPPLTLHLCRDQNLPQILAPMY